MHPRSKIWHLINYVTRRKKDFKDVRVTRIKRGAEFSTDHRMVFGTTAFEGRFPHRLRASKTPPKQNS